MFALCDRLSYISAKLRDWLGRNDLIRIEGGLLSTESLWFVDRLV